MHFPLPFDNMLVSWRPCFAPMLCKRKYRYSKVKATLYNRDRIWKACCAWAENAYKYVLPFFFRYYGYRNLNARMDVRLQVFEMNKHLFHNKDVLDIGCNVGHISIAVARDYGARSVLGIDIDPVLIGKILILLIKSPLLFPDFTRVHK